MTMQSLEIKNMSHYFWDDRKYIDEFDLKLIKLDKKESLLNIDIYYIGYITKKKMYNINSVNPLYLVIPSVEGYVEQINDSDNRNLIITSIDNDDYENITATPIDSVTDKSVVISSVDKNKKVLNKLNELWNDIEDKINASIENHNKIRFSSDVVLPLNTAIKFHALTIIIRCIIMKDGKFYAEIYLDDGLLEV